MKRKNDLRQKKYQALRSVGYNAHEANELKDRSSKVVNRYIERRKAFNASLQELKNEKAHT